MKGIILLCITLTLISLKVNKDLNNICIKGTCVDSTYEYNDNINKEIVKNGN